MHSLHNGVSNNIEISYTNDNYENIKNNNVNVLLT